MKRSTCVKKDDYQEIDKNNTVANDTRSDRNFRVHCNRPTSSNSYVILLGINSNSNVPSFFQSNVRLLQNFFKEREGKNVVVVWEQ